MVIQLFKTEVVKYFMHLLLSSSLLYFTFHRDALKVKYLIDFNFNMNLGIKVRSKSMCLWCAATIFIYY